MGTENEDAPAVRPASHPSDQALRDFVANDVEIQTTHRMAFTKVDARRTNGHVQGIAPHFVDDDVVVYASLSDFPPGWGACLVDGDHLPAALEAMAMPQGRHPGGINICDGILAVPIEHDDRYGRVYLYDLNDPLYPSQLGYFCQAIFRRFEGVPPNATERGKEDPQAPPIPIPMSTSTAEPLLPPSADEERRYRPSWDSAEGGNHQKASAAGIARVCPDWTSVPPPPGEPWDHYLVVVLHENRYLRFLPFSYESDRRELMPTRVEPGQPTEIVVFDAAGVDGWPAGKGTVVDNISLVMTTGGLRLVVMSAHGLVRRLNLQKKRRGRSTTVDRLTVFDIEVADETTDEGDDVRTVRLTNPVSGEMRWTGDAAKRRLAEFCWPGFRWGSSLTWDPRREGFVLLAAEFFGDEATPPALDPTSPAEDQQFDGDLQFLQFASNVDYPHFVNGRADRAARPAPPARIWRGGRDIFPTVAALTSHWWQARRLPPTASDVTSRPVAPAKLAVLSPLFLLACVVALAGSVWVSGLTASFALAVFGSLLGFLGAALGGILVREELEGGWRSAGGLRAAAVSVVAVLAGTGVAIWGFGAERPWLVAVAGGVAILGLGVLYEVVVRPALDDEAGAIEHARSLFGTYAITSVLGAAVVVWAIGAGLDNRGRIVVLVVGVVAALLGLIVVKYLAPVVIRGSKGAVWIDGRRGRWTQAGVLMYGGLSLVATAVGLGFLFDLLPLAVVGMWLMIVVGSMWGAVEYQRIRLSRRRSAWRVLAAAGLLVLATAGFWLGVDDLVVAAVLTLVAGLVGALFVFPGEAAAFLVALVFVGAWAAVDTEVASDQDRRRPIGESDVAADGGDRWVVALGDSFISGEGAPEFYEGTNRPGVNECHRAPTAWPDRFADHYTAMLAGQRDGAVRLVSFACSGATIDHVRSEAQHEGADDPSGGGKAQLTLLEEWLDDLPPGDAVDYVLVSAGGNDAGFSRVISACVMPASQCDDEIMVVFEQRAQSVNRELADLLDDLVETLVARRPDAGDGLPAIVVNPYLDPVGPAGGDRCSAGGVGSLLDGDELPSLRRFRSTLNGLVERAATGHRNDDGIEVLFNADGALVQGNLCGPSEGDGQRRQNWIVLQPPDGGLRSLNPATWVVGSLHPDPAGHEAIAATVCRLVEDRHRGPGAASVCPSRGPELATGGDIGNPTENRLTAASRFCGATELADCTDRWVSDRLGRAGIVLGVAALLAVVGGAVGASYASRVRERSSGDDTRSAAGRP